MTSILQVLGTPIQTIMNTEDREKFNEEVTSIGEQVAPSRAATTLEGAVEAAELVWRVLTVNERK